MTLQISMSFHNTTNVEGLELEERTEKAKSQDDQVLAVFRRFPNSRIMTPEFVHRHLIETVGGKWERTPLTSLRRSFSNLKRKGLIVKMDNVKIRGNYGMNVNTWRLSYAS